MSAERKSDHEVGGIASRARPGIFGRVTRIGMALVALGAMGSLTVQCSASNGGIGGNGNGSGGYGPDASSNGGSIATIDAASPEYSLDAFYANDPPKKNCGDGGGIPPNPGGTPECPDDKNLEGCPCTKLNETAPCWPGYRANRNQGDCHDGQTTCIHSGENNLVWGACIGYTGISKTTFKPLGTSGPAACGCFSTGRWNIANTEPCIITNSSNNSVLGFVSTYISGGSAEAGTLQVQCPSQATQPNYWNNPTPPSQPWSTDTVTADCTGQFKLCFTLKAYSALNGPASSSDCTVMQDCTSAHYNVANKIQAFPDLPGWVTATQAQKACAQQFNTNGGYGELSVDGQSDQCEQVQKVFQQMKYCPLKCSNPANKQDPDCTNCQTSGGGNF